jgi:hypothetical protein
VTESYNLSPQRPVLNARWWPSSHRGSVLAVKYGPWICHSFTAFGFGQ